MDAKSLHIRFDKVDGIIKIYNGIRHLELSNSYNDNFYRIVSRKYNSIFNRINYLISDKSGIADTTHCNFARRKDQNQLMLKELINVIML